MIPKGDYHILFIGIRMLCDLFTRGYGDHWGDSHLHHPPQPPPPRSHTTTPPQRPLKLGVDLPLQHWTRAPLAGSVEAVIGLGAWLAGEAFGLRRVTLVRIPPNMP